MTKIASQLKAFPITKGNNSTSVTTSTVFGAAFMQPYEWNCDPITGCVSVYPPGQYATLADCQANCGSPTPTLCYDIGDTGPGGGIIFAIPGFPSYVPANEYWEISGDLNSPPNLGNAYVDEPESFDGIGGVAPVLGCSNSVGGTEWGVHGQGGFAGIGTLSWGAGFGNTANLYAADTAMYSSDSAVNPGGDSACFPYTPCSPKNQNRQVAFRVAKDYAGGGFTDWFLPSWGELSIALWNVGPTMATSGFPNPLGANFANFGITGNLGQDVWYWTSSALDSPSISWAPNNNAAGFAIAVDPGTTNPWGYKSKFRCYKSRVRAVRKFTCEVVPPCTGPTCIDYNWVDGAQNLDGGCTFGSYPNPCSTYDASGNLLNSNSDSWIGGDTAIINLSQEDVLGNIYQTAMFNQGDLFKIKLWAADYSFLGEWEYTLEYNAFIWGNNYCYNRTLAIFLINPVHLSGQNALVNVNNANNGCGNAYGSHSASFVQVTHLATANTGLANAAVDTTMWGNIPYEAGGGASGYFWPVYLPHLCKLMSEMSNNCPYQPCLSDPSGGLFCSPTYTVDPSYSAIISSNYFNCQNNPGLYNGPCCGGASIVNNDNNNKSEANTLEKPPVIDKNLIVHSSFEAAIDVFLNITPSKINTTKEELTKMRRKKKR